jgi:hypothetical protein
MTARRHGKIVAKAIAEIREFYEMGYVSLRDFPEHFSGGKGRELAAKLGITLDHLEKARLFAREYSKAELGRFYREIEAGGFRVGIQHAIRLLRLPEMSQRWKFLKLTIQSRWSCRQLADAVQELTGRLPQAGRLPKIGNQVDVIRQLRKISWQWRQLRKAIVRFEEKPGTVAANGILKNRRFKNRLERCDEAIEKLYRCVLESAQTIPKPAGAKPKTGRKSRRNTTESFSWDSFRTW